MQIPTRRLAISTGLAVFTMLFGAGDLMYPLTVGVRSGDKFWIGFIGFAITAVLLPFLGFVSMTLFNGNYKSFFYRLGKPIGALSVFICVLILGPLIALPRIITLSYTMLAPFIPAPTFSYIGNYYIPLFSLVYLLATFCLTFRKERILTMLSTVIAPIILGSLAIIIIKGLFSGSMQPATLTPHAAFISNLVRGYKILDLFGALFFSSIMLSLLNNALGVVARNQPNLVIAITLKASLICTLILGVVHCGLGLLGAYHGAGLENVGAGELFRLITLRVLGTPWATYITILTILTICLSTSVALTATVAEYVQNEIFRGKISFGNALFITLLTCIPFSLKGFSVVATLTSGVLINVGYPALIALTICNLAYKLCGFKPVKVPVLATGIIALCSYYFL